MSPTDSYTRFVNRPFGKQVAKTIGLPRPVPLRRHTPGDRLASGPILVIGDTEAGDTIAEQLWAESYDVRRDPGLKQKFSALIVALDDTAHPRDLSERVLQVSTALRGLEPNGRVITVFREPQDPSVATDANIVAVRHGIEGFTRSLAKEMRFGATTNGIILSQEVTMAAPAAQAALRFLLSGRSAYVAGQFITISSTAGSLPTDWDRPLADKVIVVTGAARGIGEAISETLARDGATVIGVDMPAADEALTTVMNRIGGIAVQLDITNENAATELIRLAGQRFGRLDGIVHNAGITRDKLLANMDAARWDSLIAVNITAPLRINEQLLAELGQGVVAENFRITSLASTSGIAGNRGQTNYAAAKAGIIGMTQAFADQLAQTGGSINAVAPGFIETAMTDAMPTATREVARRMNSLQQGGRPVDVAEAIALFHADAAAGINGTTLRVCGQSMVGK
ncbi:3-oxoacyl-ACP reductase [Enteractinococcus helveticum]|uniref:3-oxoacyl-ACP reductase n=1 Tax=Enteractinococcus helveticum TaxID=1837282 RepID=A0A1B7LX82_9MICC|nr:3-oxoacyl-ACP reductase [Enteractinococcus helveticum]OAV59773.1 3-oxoacyl-ACP reductase [Enteractinococcus helveticum]